VAHAEAVFLVDHEQAQALELDLVADQRVGADDDVDGTVGQPLERHLHLLGRAKARQLRDLHRPFAEAVDDVLVVLLGQQGVGARIATCLPPVTAMKAARSATSVLPKPTSPQTRRSIGCGDTMSWITAWIAAC